MHICNTPLCLNARLHISRSVSERTPNPHTTFDTDCRWALWGYKLARKGAFQVGVHCDCHVHYSCLHIRILYFRAVYTIRVATIPAGHRAHWWLHHILEGRTGFGGDGFGKVRTKYPGRIIFRMLQTYRCVLLIFNVVQWLSKNPVCRF